MIVTVTSTVPARASSGFVWYAFDAHGCSSIDDIHEALRTVGVLRGDRIDTIVSSGVRVIRRRTPCIVGRAAIGMIAPLHTEIYDENGKLIS